MAWFLIQDDGIYRDYENEVFGDQFGRLTFCYESGKAYAHPANPEATAENDVQTFLDDPVSDLTWGEAETIIGETISRT